MFALVAKQSDKFEFKIECTMVELYRDRLIDLLGLKVRVAINIASPLLSPFDGQKKDPVPLVIKKNPNRSNLVEVRGAESREAASSAELYAIFQEGASSRCPLVLFSFPLSSRLSLLGFL